MRILYAVIGVTVVLLVLGSAVPVLWPLAAGSADNISAMTGTDVGTTTIQSFWPVILLVVGIGLAVGLIVYGLKQFGLMGGKGGLGMFVPVLPISATAINEVPLFYIAVALTIMAVLVVLRLRSRPTRNIPLTE